MGRGEVYTVVRVTSIGRDLENQETNPKFTLAMTFRLVLFVSLLLPCHGPGLVHPKPG